MKKSLISKKKNKKGKKGQENKKDLKSKSSPQNQNLNGFKNKEIDSSIDNNLKNSNLIDNIRTKKVSYTIIINPKAPQLKVSIVEYIDNDNDLDASEKSSD